jgi:hypothetical protein
MTAVGIPDDGIELDAPPKSAAAEPEEPTNYNDPTTEGPLRTKQGPDLAKYVHQLWKAQNRRYARRMVEYRLNQRRRDGETGIWLNEGNKRQDVGLFDVYAPPRAAAPIVFNMSGRLCDRLTAQMFADNFHPEVEPTQDTDDAKDSAHVAQRALDDVCSEAKANAPELHRMAFDEGHTGGSGYILWYVDPYAGGRTPKDVEAGPDATSLEFATKDPLGKPYPEEELTTKFLRPDGTLSDSAAGAALGWMPQLDGTALHAKHCRLLPGTASSVWDADGALVAVYESWGNVKRLHPEVAHLPVEQIKELCRHRPEGWHELLPMVDGKPHNTLPHDEVPPEEWLVPYLRVWVKECGDYPDGAHVAVIGKEHIAAQEPWIGQDDQGRFKLDIPLSQIRLWRKAGMKDGTATMDILGDSAEGRAAVVSAYLDYFDRLRDQKTFVPSNSTLSGKEMLLQGMGRYIPINPGGEPRYEELPAFPKEIGELFGIYTDEMSNAVALQQTAQGLDTDSSQSGRAKLAVVNQVHANLSDMRASVEAAFVRSWRIMLQLMRWKYTRPQKTSWTGEDGAYQVKRWSGSDLAGEKDVRLKAGTGTMLTPAQKIDQAIQFGQIGILGPLDIQDTIGKSVSQQLGVRDNPHWQRVRRQIAIWEETGKELFPPGMPQAPPMPPPMPMAPPPPPMGGMMPPEGPPNVPGAPLGLDPATGQPLPPPAHPEALKIFEPRLCDTQADVAAIRQRELGRMMASVTYEQFPQEWRQPLDDAYAMASQALMPPAPPEEEGKPGKPGKPPAEDNSGQLSPTEKNMAGMA